MIRFMNYKNFPYIVTLDKIQSSHNRLRSDQIIGWTEKWPELNESFVLYTEPLENKNADFRRVNTSPLVEILYRDDLTLKFRTESGSIYSATFTYIGSQDLTS